MLVQFTIKNYKCFKDEAILSMEASADKEHPENVISFGKERLIKAAAVFGANASGKSSLFQALTAGILAVRDSNKRQVNQPISVIIPFKFDDGSVNEGIEFEFVFIESGTKYVYRFKATMTEVISESLLAYKSAKPTTIFERDETREPVYRFTSSALKKELQPLTGRNTKNKMFLATATEWNSKETAAPFRFFQKGINTYSSDYSNELPNIGRSLEQDKDGSLREFIKQTLRNSDISIDGFMFEAKDMKKEEFLAGFPPQVRGIIPFDEAADNRSYSIRTIHNVKGEEGRKPYALDIMEESEGTRAIFTLAPILRNAFLTGEVVCVDEMDRSLHPALLQYLVKCFMDVDLNVNNAQLIMSSHMISLLSLELLRRDQIYFVEKDRMTGQSELYSLDEFSPRKTEDIRKAYLLGRYGAVPEIQ